jgi:hypothetical protein
MSIEIKYGRISAIWWVGGKEERFNNHRIW